MNKVIYTYTGEMNFTESEVTKIEFDSFDAFYKGIGDTIAKKLGCDKEAVEVVKVSGYSGKSFAKVSYRLHFEIDTDAIRMCVCEKIPYDIKSFEVKAVDDRLFKVTVVLNCFRDDKDAWKKKLVPAKAEEKLKAMLPTGLIPKVTYYINYPITATGKFIIEWEKATKGRLFLLQKCNELVETFLCRAIINSNNEHLFTNKGDYMQILKEEVRERIVDASARIFISKGVEKTTIRDIAKEANASTGNIYRYFKSKDEIVLELMHQFENKLKEFDKRVDIDIFALEDKKIEEFIDGIVELMREQYLDMKLMCISNSYQINEMKNIIIDAISKRIQYRFKKLNVDKMMARTIAHSTFEGIRLIISESKNFNKKVEMHLKKYLKFELTNLVPRIQGV